MKTFGNTGLFLATVVGGMTKIVLFGLCPISAFQAPTITRTTVPAATCTISIAQKHTVDAFQTTTASALYGNNNKRNDAAGGNCGFTNSDYQYLKYRLMTLRMHALEVEMKRPPNPDYTAEEFVTELLKSVWDSSDPLPNSGFRMLLRASTKEWKQKMYAAVGAPDTAKEEDVAAALGDAISRPNNQYNILVAEAEEYVPVFPSEPVDYDDGTCWIECQFRGKNDNHLLAATGWQLERNTDGAWVVARIDWQDFRDEYRPGVGREEWISVVA